VKRIDRFIPSESGKMPAGEVARAVAGFKALGPEAVPLLIDELNRAANIGSNCPAVIACKGSGLAPGGTRR
jgi:hypothetical protein